MGDDEFKASIAQTLAMLANQQQQMAELQTQFSEHLRLSSVSSVSTSTSSPGSILATQVGVAPAINAFKFASFDESVESFTDFLDRLDSHFQLHGVSESNKAHCLVAALPPKLFKLMKNLLYPATFDKKTYSELKTVLSNHLNPVPLVIPSRHALFTQLNLQLC